MKARDPRREVGLHLEPAFGASTIALAERLLGSVSTPSEHCVREETKARLEEALNSMSPGEREILSLRHFEELTNAEVAAELGLRESTASKRYIRAIVRLKGLLAQLGVESGL